ncbi:UDP-N-acetylmuramate dehydrogenase [Kordia sp. YSTF-M3]|uniref:UDP-N-acetylenolpyruvoylglucosamine reductase n=1 Tax=Kordia aestuariivivens TaxID=2759037 RepID=A0ABR7Q4W8_9FLAO|nr:UDP-N-acetylmuramate dehydrogenase [Kordia aestuariivivens]MBC8753590.1 UDP-N-acetylmuramate dehydrogenase [Kordia aestuariivivens]
MSIQHNVSLKEFNTFGIDAKAKKFITITNISELLVALQLTEFSEYFVLGGGSNMLLTQDIELPVLHINNKGKRVVYTTNNEVVVEIQAGENWHEFVLWCIENDFGGVENLSLIPGNVGTSPIQNIGAYGVELKDTFVRCTAIDIETQEQKVFMLDDCNFGYRNSIFKNEAKGKYIITSVVFKLTHKNHKLNTSYGAIQEELAHNNITNPTIKNVSDAVIAIRERKLPNPKEIGNSGSFFKNPVISKADFDTLEASHSTIPHYVISDTEIKVPAGWLIEQCGFKGKRYGDAGVHKNQALVLVNYDNATGAEILALAKKIQETVLEKFNIAIEAEVNVI